MPDRLTNTVKTEIAARVVGVLAPTLAFVIVISSVSTYLLNPEQWTRHIPALLALVLLIADCWLIRKGKILAAAHLFVALLCTGVLTGMILNGGIHAPAYTAIMGLVAVFAWLYGPRAAIFFFMASTAIGGLFVWLHSIQFLPEIPPPSTLLFWILLTMYQLVVLISTAIPNRMLYQALKEAESRRKEAEDAQHRELQASTHLMQSEEQLRESEQRLRYLASNIPSAMLYEITIEPNGTQKFTYVGDNIEEVFEVTAESVLADSSVLYSLIVPGFIEGLKKAEEEALQHMSLFRHDVQFRLPSGKQLWCRISSTPTKHPNGNITWNGLVFDITAEKEVEEKLYLFRRAVEASTDAIGMSSADGHHWYQNDAFNRLFGDYTQIGADPPATLYADTKIGREVFDTIKSGTPWSGEVQMNSASNEMLDILLRAYAVEDDEGRIAGLVGVHTDITERKKAEEELVSARSMLAAAIAQSPSGILVADAPNVTIRLANPAALGIRGKTGQLLTGIELEKHAIHWNTFFPDGSPCPPEALPLSRAVLKGETSQNEEIVIRDDNGEDHWVSVNAAPIKDPSGKVTAGIVVFHEITDQKNAEEEKVRLETQLRQSQKLEAIGQLAGGIAHDFNNILTAILGNLELSMDDIRQKMGRDHHVVESMEQIEKSARRASTLTRQLLAFSRKELQQPDILNLNQIITDIDKMLKRLISAKIQLKTNPGANLNSIHADANQIEQILVNLVVNAADAMPNGGTVTIQTENVDLDENFLATHPEAEVGPHVMLTVSDTGHGMDAATQERIFEPFFTTKPPGKGTGLGLAMVYGIIRQSDAHISVYSEPEKGTIFRVYFPTVDGKAVPTQKPSANEEVLHGTETILLCEDDDSVRSLTALLLKSGGYTVLEANGGSQAEEIIRNHEGPIDMLVTDVIMADIDGLQLARKLQDILPDLPTLFISGYTSDVIAHHGILNEGVEFLEKPFTRARLLARVREVLNSSRKK